MKRFITAVVLILLTASSAQAQHLHIVPHTTTHFDTYRHGNHTHTVPHTTTHYDRVWHNGPDYVPHTTTHYDRVWHNGHIDSIPHTTTHYDRVFPYSNAVSPSIVYPSPSLVAAPVVVQPSIVSMPSPVISAPPVVSQIAAAPIATYAASKVEATPPVNVIPNSNSINVIPASPPANVIPNAIPGVRRSIVISNPRDTGGALNYSVNSFAYTIRPGESQTLTLDREWTISFDNGLGKQVSYRLSEGKFKFSVSPESGWTIGPVAEPTNAPAPPVSTPEGPTL